MTAPVQNVRTTRQEASEKQQLNRRKDAVPRKIKRWPMVGWYDPNQLAKTGIEVAVSTIFGRHSDQRLVEAMTSGDEKKDFYEYTCHYKDDGKEFCELDQAQPRRSIRIDDVGDAGDGWNSTYAIAYHLAETGRTFTYRDKDSNEIHQTETKRSDLLIFGGDEVYPTASRKMYEERLVKPYKAALRNGGTTPRTSSPCPVSTTGTIFTRFFMARRWFAGWRTRQSRSYFALKIPHDWWLLGTDMQLGSDSDAPQMKYFQSLNDDMDEANNSGEPASIILCHAEPHFRSQLQREWLCHNVSPGPT